MQDFRRERHSVSRLTVHLVCVTKYRRKLFDAAALGWLPRHFAKVCEQMACQLLARDGEAAHLRAVIEYPPKLSISVLVNALKGTSSRMLRKERPDIAGRYDHGVLWSPSYFVASTGGAPLELVRQYVDQQHALKAP